MCDVVIFFKETIFEHVSLLQCGMRTAVVSEEQEGKAVLFRMCYET